VGRFAQLRRRRSNIHNPAIIEPPKATKGRRMSKQTRKKSSKAKTAKANAAKPKPATKRPAGKSATKVASKLTKKPEKASHKPASKTLRKAAVEKTVAKSAVTVVPSVARFPAPAAKNAAQTAAVPSKPRLEKLAKPLTQPGVLAEGAKAPAFALPRDGGETVTLASYSGKKLAIFFYPRADTPGCTREAIDFTRLANDFAACETSVIGVSADPLKAQESFRDKHQLTIPLISDEAHRMLEAYGAWGEKSMYGRTFQGVLRTTVLVGADGRVARIWRGVKVDGHADEVLAVAQTL
jgi:peroxiredoxin Q/BCP